MTITSPQGIPVGDPRDPRALLTPEYLSAPPDQRQRGLTTQGDWLVPSWSLAHYKDLLDEFTARDLPFLRWDEFQKEEPGVWLRHDVELDAGSALRMAQVEHERGIQASYFLCWDSPSLNSADPAMHVETAGELTRLGHLVGLHSLAPVEPEHLPSWCSLDAVTYHVPTTSPATLAGYPGADAVYGPVAKGRCGYVSDSTGRWRRAHPQVVASPDRPLQLLTHPFWWSKGQGAPFPWTAALERFLPQAAAER